MVAAGRSALRPARSPAKSIRSRTLVGSTASKMTERALTAVWLGAAVGVRKKVRDAAPATWDLGLGGGRRRSRWMGRGGEGSCGGRR